MNSDRLSEYSRQVAPGSKATRSPTFTLFTFDPTVFHVLGFDFGINATFIRTFSDNSSGFMSKNLCIGDNVKRTNSNE